MISRRLIRVKTFQVLFSSFSQQEIDFNKSYKELKKSILKTQDLHFLLLRLLIDIKDLNKEKLNIKKNKHLASSEDLNPKTKFIENRLIKLFEENKQYLRYQNDNTLNWSMHSNIVEKIYNSFIKSETYLKYINTEDSSFKSDKKIISFFFEEIVGSSTELIDLLEEISIYWTEDFEFVINNILKNIRQSKENDSDEKKLSEVYKNDDDKQFAYNLLKFTLENHDEHIDLIEKYAKNWDIDRLIQIDIILMEMGLSELIYLDSIPIKVSLDEYIELSKFYSSSKSRIFINGILDKIIIEFKENGRILKKGRGLIGQI